MAESAAVGTSAHDFHNSVVLCRLEAGNGKMFEPRMLGRCSERGVHCPVCQFLAGIPETRNLPECLDALLAGLVLAYCLNDIL